MKTDLTKELERVITIDGKGRPWKAGHLESILINYNLADVMEALQEIKKRKAF